MYSNYMPSRVKCSMRYSSPGNRISVLHKHITSIISPRQDNTGPYRDVSRYGTTGGSK